MQFDLDIDRLSIEIGISSNRLSKDIETYSAISEIFPSLEVENCDVGLFGGTAINKIYFGKRQRLSYDIDIFAESPEKTLNVLKKAGATVKHTAIMPSNLKVRPTKLLYKGIVIDLVKAGRREVPRKMQAYDLLYYYKQLVPPIVVPSYSLEYLLAEKTMALLERNELKDVYDTWLGRSLLSNPETYVKHLKGIAKGRGVKDLEYFAGFQMANMLANIRYYENRSIEALDMASPSIMLKDIEAFLKDKL